VDFDVEGNASEVDLVKVVFVAVHEIDDHSGVEGEVVAH
jgi:hypothetical protein